MKKLILCLIFFVNITAIHANPQSVIWYTHTAGEQVNINVDLFMSSTCPHCHKADAFFREIEKKNAWLHIHRYVINQDKSALQTFYEYLKQQNSMNFSVPAIFFCDSHWTGFVDANTTGKSLLHALTYCRQKIIQQGELSPSTSKVLQKWGAASEFQIQPAAVRSSLTLVAFTAIIDALAPCTLFCFAAFLAFLWLFPTQKWVQFSVGGCFLLSLGLIHYVQQVQSAFYYQMVPKLTIPTILVGLILLAAVWSTYRTEYAKVEFKRGLLGLAVVFFTVIAIIIYQQTCVFNISLVLEQWLTEHSASPAIRIVYQLIYQVLYLIPLVLLLLFYLIFGRHKRMIYHQRMLNIAARLILISIGVILVVYPPLLANFLVSMAIPVASIVVAIIYRYRYEQVN